MTRITVKADLFRRPFTIYNRDEDQRSWTLECSSFLPITFDAENAGEAVEEAFKLVPTLRRNPLAIKKRAANPNAFGRGASGSETQNGTSPSTQSQLNSGVPQSEPQKAKKGKAETATEPAAKVA